MFPACIDYLALGHLHIPKIAELDGNLLDYEKRREAFAPELIRLERSRKAFGLEGDNRGVVALRSRQDDENQELADALALLPEKEKGCADALIPAQAEANMKERIRRAGLDDEAEYLSARLAGPGCGRL